MSGNADPETRLIGKGADPGRAEVGTIRWAVDSAIREIIGTELDPMKAAARRDLVTKLDFAQGWTICPDYIDDCFNDLEKEIVAKPSQHEVGEMLWAIDLAVRETVADDKDPGRTAKRRELIMGMEITKGKEVNRDDIVDFFTNATDRGTTRPYHPPPAEHEGVTSTGLLRGHARSNPSVQQSSYGSQIFSNLSSIIHLDPTVRAASSSVPRAKSDETVLGSLPDKS